MIHICHGSTSLSNFFIVFFCSWIGSLNYTVTTEISIRTASNEEIMIGSRLRKFMDLTFALNVWTLGS